MQTDFCWNYFCASKGDIITEESYGSSNYKNLKEKKQLCIEYFSLQDRNQYTNALLSTTVLFLSTQFIVLFSGYPLTFSCCLGSCNLTLDILILFCSGMSSKISRNKIKIKMAKYALLLN